MKLILLLVIASSFLFSDIVHAKKKKRRKKRSQIAVVQVDGSAVYKVANFDSPIIAYLNKGRKIRASKKIYPGIGGLGSFYKVRLKKGKYGYVTDVDLFPAKSKGSTESNSAANDVFTPQGGDDHAGPAVGNNKSGFMSRKRYIGLTYSMVSYSEEIIKKVYTENLGFIGVKLSGPGALFTQMPLELNLSVFMGAPEYYSVAFDNPDGYTIMSDVLYIYTLMDQASYTLYLGVGPSLTYSSYRVDVKKLSNGNSVNLDSQFVDMGISGMLGFGLSLGQSFAIKLEGKYIYQNQGQISFGGALQYAY